MPRSDTKSTSKRNWKQIIPLSQVHQECHSWLSQYKFGTVRTINWEALHVTGLREDVDHLFNVVARHQVLTAFDPVYHVLTLEFLSTLKRLQCNDVLGKSQTIYFQIGGQNYYLNYNEFPLFIGIYDREYTLTNKYHNISSSHPPGESQTTHWRKLSDCG